MPRPRPRSPVLFLAVAVAVALAACGAGTSQPTRRGWRSAGAGVPSFAPRAAAGAQPAPAVASLAGGVLADADGQPVALHGFSWFGLNDGTGSLAGLWAAGEPLAGEFATVVWRQKLLGFNAVRLPFSFGQLAAPARSMAAACATVTAGEVGLSVLPPDSLGAGTPPPLPRPPVATPGRCNDQLPTGSQRELLLYIVAFYLDQGFYVLLDNHLREDPLALDQPAAWAAAWGELAAEVYALPGAAGRVFLDLLNEPGQRGVGWGPRAGGPALGELYLAAMAACEGQVPGLPIYFVEGAGQDGIDANWGDGFCTDPVTVAARDLGDPRPFFGAVAKRPEGERVVLAPHVYGPAVTGAVRAARGAPLFARLTASFGALNLRGWGPAGDRWFPPVAIGEFGSKFEDPSDVAFMDDFAAYLAAAGAGDDGLHRPVTSWFYWAWNANSGDTGGLVADDWHTLQWRKLTYLEGLGLAGWRGAGATAGRRQPTAEPGPAPAAAPEPEPAPAPADPPSHPVSPPTSLPDIDNQRRIVARLHRDASWGQEGDDYVSLNVYLTVLAGPPLEAPYRVRLGGPAFARVAQAWNLYGLRVAGGDVEGDAEEEWQRLEVGDPEVNLGLIYVVRAGDEDRVTQVWVDGVAVDLR